MAKREGLVKHPFKQRRRWNFACAFLLFCVVSGIAAFVPLSQNRPPAAFLPHALVYEDVKSGKSRHWRGRSRFSLLLRADAKVPAQEARDDGKSDRISPEQLELIKESTDIVSVIESYGLPGFQRHGNNRAKAICPFHDDHNPSLSVDGERGIYKCFACGAGGDVFSFVREYEGLKRDEPMSFYQAVRHVAHEFGDPNLKLHFVSSFTSRMSEEEREALNQKKRRLLLANAAAAAFYGKSLIALPAAGVARSHIRERGLSPTTVKAFAIGYAPDSYFRLKGEWGEGSLVHHLRDLGITPSEMIEAGLATRTKGSQWKESRNNNNRTSDDNNESNEDYSTLIDRFRNRLVVPIFDARGANVLGFGARILPPEENKRTGHKAPKYINSPESPVFQKKNVLFGQHYASEAVRDIRQNDAVGESGPNRGSVVIVEGYMDAISLWEAGIHEVVASMGTALTMKQLSNAAKTAGTHGGRIVLCLDADEAGLNAIERLCTGSLLSTVAETYVVEVLVATLPAGVKDPGEYIESQTAKDKSRAGSHFRKEVIDKAKDWTAWYLDRLLSRYDDAALRGTAGSFADICDRVSDFLSRFPNPLERTKRAYDIAGSLADIVSGASGSRDGSNALRIQLEKDLVSMVARKAGARESIERRIESVDGYSADTVNNRKLAKMTEGDGVSRMDDSWKLSNRAVRALNKMESSKACDGDTGKFPRRRSAFDGDSGFSSTRHERKRARMQRPKKKILTRPPLTPHFSGFEFENPTDVDWLNLPREKWKRTKKHLTLGTATDGEQYAKAIAARMGEEHIADLFTDDLVYFNSNDYHGQQFVTEDAVLAGYSNADIARDASIFEHGVGTLVQQDTHALINAAEEKLLKNIVRYDCARTAMIHSLATSDATGSTNQIQWSQPERAWLFERLVKQPQTIPKEALVDGRVKDLHRHLANLPDAPIGAFGFIEAGAAHVVNDGMNTGELFLSRDKKAPEDVSDDALGVSILVDEMNASSDYDDIERWAASYDPSMFDEADPAFDLAQCIGEDGVSAIDVKSVSDENDVGLVNGEAPPGCLDMLFAPEDDLFAATYDASVSRELRAELEVQEAHITLLRASALKELEAAKAQWLTVGQLLAVGQDGSTGSNQTSVVDGATGTSVSEDSIVLNSMQLDALQEQFNVIATEVRDITERIHHLDVSSRRLGLRLIDYSNADGIEGRLSLAQQEELASMVDEHVNSLPGNWKAPEIVGRFHNNRDPMLGWDDDNSLERVEFLEKDMAQINKDWGEWAEDDFVWSMQVELGSSTLSSGGFSSSVPNVLDSYELEARSEEERESLEETLNRLDSEWAGWDDVRIPVLSTDTEASYLDDDAFLHGRAIVSNDFEEDSTFNEPPGNDLYEGGPTDSVETDFDSIFE